MAVPESRKSKNIKLSLNKFIKDNFETPFGYAVSYQEVQKDVSTTNQWLEINFLQENAGRKGVTLVQFDCYSRVFGISHGSSDPYRGDLDQMADRLHAALHVDSIQIYDYTNPASPAVISNAKLMVQNSNGTFREPEEDVNFEATENGVARRVLTYNFRLLVDASQADNYYD